MFLQGLIILANILLVTCSLLPKSDDSAPSFEFNFETVQTIPETKNLENLGIRRSGESGEILVTSTSSNVLYQVSPDKSIPAVAVTSFTGVLSLLGIVELAQDVFYVAGSNLSGPSAAAGSNRIYEVDMQSFISCSSGSVIRPASISLLKHFPAAGLFNGMSRLTPGGDDHVLIADSAMGTVTKLNVQTKDHSVILQDSSMAPLPGGLGLGINGIHMHRGTLYYTSLDQGLFAAIRLSETGIPIGAPEILASGIVAGDDFALLRNGKKAIIANNGQNTITEVDMARKTAHIAANSSYLQDSSSVLIIKSHKGSALLVTGSKTIGHNDTVGRLARTECFQ